MNFHFCVILAYCIGLFLCSADYEATLDDVGVRPEDGERRHLLMMDGRIENDGMLDPDVDMATLLNGRIANDGEEDPLSENDDEALLSLSAMQIDLSSGGKLMNNSAPARDVDAANRMGSIDNVNIPSTWGVPPFPLGYSASGPFTGDLSKSYGQLLTDSSQSGHRIRKQLLDAHNYVRQLESPAATYMTKLIYDFHLEGYATQWANYLCTANQKKFFEHSPDSHGFPAWPWRGGQGENLYTTSGLRTSDHDFSEVIYKWYAEKEYYDWNSGKAKPSNAGPVGHYTQLVRQDATAVGCAVITGCKQQGDWRTFVACQYDWGNSGKDPYVKRTSNFGAVCDQCPNGFDCCEKNLCAGQAKSQVFTPYSPAKTYSTEWYGCKNHLRACGGTGALTFETKVPGDPYDLEFHSCHCGRGSGHDNIYDSVSKGYLWYRDRCFKLSKTSSQGRSLLQLGSSSPVLSKKSSTQPIHEVTTESSLYLDNDEEHPHVFLQIGHSPTSSNVDIAPPPLSQWRMKLSNGFDSAPKSATSTVHDGESNDENVSKPSLRGGGQRTSNINGPPKAVRSGDIIAPPSQTDFKASNETLSRVEVLNEVVRNSPSISGYALETNSSEPQKKIVKALVSAKEAPILEDVAAAGVTNDNIDVEVEAII